MEFRRWRFLFFFKLCFDNFNGWVLKLGVGNIAYCLWMFVADSQSSWWWLRLGWNSSTWFIWNLDRLGESEVVYFCLVKLAFFSTNISQTNQPKNTLQNTYKKRYYWLPFPACSGQVLSLIENRETQKGFSTLKLWLGNATSTRCGPCDLGTCLKHFCNVESSSCGFTTYLHGKFGHNQFRWQHTEINTLTCFLWAQFLAPDWVVWTILLCAFLWQNCRRV